MYGVWYNYLKWNPFIPLDRLYVLFPLLNRTLARHMKWNCAIQDVKCLIIVIACEWNTQGHPIYGARWSF